jgi:hypothetical protein
MRLFLFIAALLVTFGCNRQFFPPVHPAVINCSGQSDIYIMNAIAKSYNMKVTFDKNFEPTALTTIVFGTFSTDGVPLNRLLKILANPKVDFYIRHNVIHVFRPTLPEGNEDLPGWTLSQMLFKN